MGVISPLKGQDSDGERVRFGHFGLLGGGVGEGAGEVAAGAAA